VAVIGLTVSHGESLLAVKLRVPVPRFATEMVEDDGFADPTVAPRAIDVGLTLREGVEDVTVAYADMGESFHLGPADQVAGSAARFVWLLFSETAPPAESRNAKVPVPAGESTLIQ
jgi:hypothetical protein